MALEITSLSAIGVFPIANNDESVTVLPLPTRETPIWDGKASESATGGSLGPVAFRLGSPFTLRIKGSVTYPVDWVTPALCDLVGIVQGKGPDSDKMAILRATWSQVLTGPPNRQAEEKHEFDVLLELTGPLVGRELTSFLPFAIRGDVEWTLTGGLGMCFFRRATSNSLCPNVAS